MNELFNGLFDDATLETLRELEIDPDDAVFVKKRLFGKPVNYACRLGKVNGLYGFALPYAPRPPRSFKKRLAALNRRLLAVNAVIIRKVFSEAKRNAEFVARFNAELFFKNVYYNDIRLTADELFRFYGTDPYYKKINLSADRDKQPFIAMYAIAFCECSAEDVFTVDGIFSPQPQRRIDNAKKKASNEVFGLIFRGDKAEINEVLEGIGAALINIAPPPVDLADPGLLARNYTLYAALAEIGRVFAEVFFYNGNRGLDGALKAAEELKRFANVAALCEKMAALRDDEDYRETEEYKKCADNS